MYSLFDKIFPKRIPDSNELFLKYKLTNIFACTVIPPINSHLSTVNWTEKVMNREKSSFMWVL